MQVTKPGGTREQTALVDWYEYSFGARARLAAVVGNHVPSILSCFDSWSAAVAFFGECELHARAHDRSVILDVYAEQRPWLTTLVNKRNETGIGVLEHLHEVQLPTFSREITALEVDSAQVTEVVDEIDQSFRENLADWEIAGDEARELLRAFRQVCDVVRSEGIGALGQYLDRTCTELIAARRASNRGTHHNYVPFWKILIIVGMFGWLLAGAIVGSFTAGRSTAQTAAVLGISISMVIGAFVALILFC